MTSKPSTLERWRFSRTVLLPALLMLAVMGCAVAAFVLWSSVNIDQRALERQTSVAAYALNGHLDAIEHELSSVAISDETVMRARYAYDIVWIEKNLGRWMNNFFHHSRLVLLDANSEPLYVMANGDKATKGAYEIGIKPGLLPLVSRVRQAISAGGIDAYLNGERDTPPSATAYAIIEGRPAAIAMMPVISTNGAIRLARGSEYLLASIKFLDDELATRLTKEFLLDDAAFVSRPSTNADRATQPISNVDGRFIAFFEWTRDRPGALMLNHAGPALLIAFAIVATLVFLLTAKIRKSSAALEDGRRNAEYMANHDRLTGLPNRACFDIRLQQILADQMRTGARIDLLLLDLDRFKQVNDTLGHQAGDELICKVGERIRDVVGPNAFIARIGGDEFSLIFVTQSGPMDPVAVSDRIIDAIGQPYALQQFRAFVGTSIGIVTATRGNADPRELVRRADIALYEAKSGGRNRAVVYEEHMNELLQMQHTIEAELREALAAGDQLQVAFQPLVDQQTRRVIGAEALVRWTHPKYGPISPARFIPVAENTGLIEAVGSVVLRRACELGQQAPGRTIAVNISPAQLRNPNFSSEVFGILAQTGMRADDLELEITESILLDDEQASSENLRTFREAGIHIALDDFGTGYSSLSYLKRYPVDRIKIDRSFVSQLAPGHDSVAITTALVTLAHAMRMSVTAEGVETEQQADILGNLGCNILQGFLFSGAVDRHAILDIFAQPENLPMIQGRQRLPDGNKALGDIRLAAS